jgi:hypothetical protein
MFGWMRGTARGAQAQFQDLGQVYSLASNRSDTRPAWVFHRITRITSTLIFVDFHGQLHSLNRVKLDRDGWVFTSDVRFYSEAGMRRVTAEWVAREAAGAKFRSSHADDKSDILGLGPTYTREDVVSSFRRRAFELHPDNGGDAQQFAHLVEARNRALDRIRR